MDKKKELHKKLDDALEKGHQVFLNVVKVKPYVPDDGSILCQNCEEPFFRKDSPLNVYCSYDCQKERHLNQNKNPFTKTSIKERRIPLHRNVVDSRTTCSYDEVVIDNAIMEHLEHLCTDQPYVQEDLEWLEEEGKKGGKVEYVDAKKPEYSWEKRSTRKKKE